MGVWGTGASSKHCAWGAWYGVTLPHFGMSLWLELRGPFCIMFVLIVNNSFKLIRIPDAFSRQCMKVLVLDEV